MCVRLSIAASAEEIEEFYQNKLPHNIEPFYNAPPLQAYAVLSSKGVQMLTWGHQIGKERILHKAFEDHHDYERGVLAVTGFFAWKTEKNTAPIGFGDHRERTHLKPFLFKHENDEIIGFAVCIKDDIFYLLTTAANDDISNFQPNMPYTVDAHHKWIEGDDGAIEPFADLPYVSYMVCSAANDPGKNLPEVVERYGQ